MSKAPFDASRVFEREALDPSVAHNQRNTIVGCRGNVSALELLLAQSKRELQEAVYYCNQKAWGYWDTELGAPPAEQASELVERMDQVFAAHARDARHLRVFCAEVSAALDAANTKALEDMHERGRKSQEADDLAAFEAHEASQKQRRFEDWRARR